MVRFNVRKELHVFVRLKEIFSLGKIPFLFPSKITKNSIRHAKQLIDLRKIICLRKSEVSVERNSVCNVIENSAEHDIHCLSCSFTNDIINMLAYNYGIILMSNHVNEITFCQGTKRTSL